MHQTKRRNPGFIEDVVSYRVVVDISTNAPPRVLIRVARPDQVLPGYYPEIISRKRVENKKTSRDKTLSDPVTRESPDKDKESLIALKHCIKFYCAIDIAARHKYTIYYISHSH